MYPMSAVVSDSSVSSDIESSFFPNINTNNLINNHCSNKNDAVLYSTDQIVSYSANMNSMSEFPPTPQRPSIRSNNQNQHLSSF